MGKYVCPECGKPTPHIICKGLEPPKCGTCGQDRDDTVRLEDALLQDKFDRLRRLVGRYQAECAISYNRLSFQGQRRLNEIRKELFDEAGFTSQELDKLLAKEPFSDDSSSSNILYNLE